jgi:hypothetical protein
MAIEITKMAVVNRIVSGKPEVSTVYATDPASFYSLRIYYRYTSTVEGIGSVIVSVGSITESLGVGTLQPGSAGDWNFSLTYFTHDPSSSIADLVRMAGLSDQLTFSAYVYIIEQWTGKKYTSNTASVTVKVLQAPSVTITKVAVETSAGEVTSLAPNESVDKYSVVAYYTTTAETTTFCKLNIIINGVPAQIYGTLYGIVNPGGGKWEIPFTYFASGTIADLMRQYGVTGNQITFCVDACE